jgi:DNA-binding NarL/FixJ family response regulator
MIRVFLLDDHALVRTGFRLILSGETDIDVVGEAGSGEDGLARIRQLKPDIVLCDLHLPGISGLEVTDRIVRGGLATRVIVVTSQDEGPLPRRLLEAGASGYLAKACPASELLAAIRQVARGKRYIDSELAQKMALGTADGSPFDSLTPREFEVAMLICRGLRAGDIAKRLSLSPKTIATHKSRMLEKLDVADAVSMSQLATQYGLLETR